MIVGTRASDISPSDPEAVFINEDNNFEELVDSIKKKEFRRIYMAPEQLTSGPMRKLCKDTAWTKDVLAYIIDEAHVVVEWGGTFRPVYQKLSDLRYLSGRKFPIMATSATIPVASFNTLCDNLAMKNPAVINIGSARPNIYLKVVPFKKRMSASKDIVAQLSELKTLKPGGKSLPLPSLLSVSI